MAKSSQIWLKMASLHRCVHWIFCWEFNTQQFLFEVFFDIIGTFAIFSHKNRLYHSFTSTTIPNGKNTYLCQNLLPVSALSCIFDTICNTIVTVCGSVFHWVCELVSYKIEHHCQKLLLYLFVRICFILMICWHWFTWNFTELHEYVSQPNYCLCTCQCVHVECIYWDIFVNFHAPLHKIVSRYQNWPEATILSHFTISW